MRMGSITNLLNSSRVFEATGNMEQKLIHLLANGNISLLAVLGPLLFNIYMCDLFLFMSQSNVANYADDTSLYACEKRSYGVQRKFESESLKLFERFHDN